MRLSCVTGHQAAASAIRASCSKRATTDRVSLADEGAFNSSNSGTKIPSLASSSRGVAASATNPGTCSLSATHTPASPSQQAWITMSIVGSPPSVYLPSISPRYERRQAPMLTDFEAAIYASCYLLATTGWLTP